MKNITTEMVLRFAVLHEGEVFLTLKKRRPFHFHVENGIIISFPKSGTPFNMELEDYVNLFNRRGSFRPGDYPKRLWSNSYFTSLIDAMINNRKRGDNEGGTPSHLLEDIANSSVTEKQELLKSRVGQGKFRRLVVQLRSTCYVTRISDPRLLRASHIKAWQVSANRERLDPFNGLLLTPNYDHLFDQGFISFRDDGRILVSPKLPKPAIAALGIDVKFEGRKFDLQTREYLKHHRKRFRALAST